MPRWLKVIRGMIGTGLAFAAGGSAVVAAIGSFFWIFGEATLLGVTGIAARSAVLSFVIGLVFSGILALAAHGRQFEKLSLGLFTGLGGGVGMAAWLAMGLNGAFRAWDFEIGLVNLILLTAMGAGAAAGTLLVARMATASRAERDEQILRFAEHDRAVARADMDPGRTDRALGEGNAQPADASHQAARASAVRRT